MSSIFKDILDVLGNVPTYFSFIYPIFYLLKYKNNTSAYKYFTLYLVSMALVQLIMKLYVKLELGDSNLFMFIYFMTFQFVLLSFFFYDLLRYRLILVLMSLVLIFLGIQYAFEPELYYRYNPTGIIITQAILVIYALLYFYRSLSNRKQFAIVTYGMFIYLISSILIFASGNLVFNKYIPKSLLSNLQDLNLVLYFVFQLFIVVEWVKNYSGFFKKTNS